MHQFGHKTIPWDVNKMARVGCVAIVCLGLVAGIAALLGVFSANDVTAVGQSQLITSSASRKLCIYPLSTNGNLQPGLVNAETAIGVPASCVSAFLTGATNWSQWENPWILESYKGYTEWVAAKPRIRQLVLQVNLIPNDLQDEFDPLGWEQTCADGQFDPYVTQLGRNLVAAGLGNSVIRLGAEMNGTWEADYVGTTTYEQNEWARCFAKEVTAIRQVPHEHFLIVWNPNACTENIPYANYYPGNAYVDILGLDLYDGLCTAPSNSTTRITWNQLVDEPAGLAAFEAFAQAHKKPMSFPEWGLLDEPNGDDPAYIDGIGSTFKKGNFAFESYFDAGDGGTLQLGPTTPLADAAFQKWFGATAT